MNKKGFFGEATLWLFRIAATLAAVGIMIFLINSSFERNLDLGDLRYYPVAERILYSKNCFIKVEDNRPMPGVFVLENVNQDNLDECMEPIKDPIGLKLIFYYDGDEEEFYYNKETYDDLSPLTFSSQFYYVGKRYMVLVEDKGELKPGNIKIEAVWQK